MSAGDGDRGNRREAEFRRNPELERLLAELEGPLLRAEEALLAAQAPDRRRPIVLIVGCARSGSTLLLQFLAASGVFGYPSNFLSRFYAAPAVGARIQRLLFDPACRFRDELALRPEDASPYSSELGKTRGALAPNEFHYFWRRWLRETDGRPPQPADAEGVDFEPIDAELQGLAAAFERPLALKAHLLGWVLPQAAARLPDAYVVFLRRDPLFNAQSLLEARVRYFGSPETWYSLRPPELASTAGLSPAAQVARQVALTEGAIEAGLEAVDPARVLRLTYEDLCARPAECWDRLAAALGAHPSGPELGAAPRARPFASANVERLPAATLEEIRDELSRPTQTRS